MNSKQRRVILIAVLVLTQAAWVGAQNSTTSSLDVPTFAGVIGDGSVVSFSWWAVRSAVTYDLLRAPAPDVKVVTVASLRSGTLGYQDVQPAAPMYYQLVAVRADGTRASGSWFLYQAPTIQSVSADGTDVLVTWSAVPSPPGGYEVWRTSLFAPVRAGAVSGNTLSYRDAKVGGGRYYYQVVAVGAGGRRAASPWFPFNGGPTQQQENVAALIAQELANYGIPLSQTEESALVNGVIHGGKAGIDLAQYIAQSLAEVPAQPETQGTVPRNPVRPDPGGITAPGDPVQPPDQGNTDVVATKVQLSPKQVDDLIAKLSAGSGSKHPISQLVVAKLNQLKGRR